jgi:hypothetical protein
MKSISRFLLFLAVVTFAFTGCDTDDFTGQSTMVPTTPFPGITVSELPMNVIFQERDTTLEFTFTMASIQTVDVSIKISVDPSSTATEGEDFQLNSRNVVIPAFTTTGSFSVDFFVDGIPEPDAETVVINVGDNTTANAVFAPQQMSVTLTNFSLPTMDILVDWEGEFEFAGLVFPICPNVDIDPVAIADDAGTYSYSNDWGACPEIFTGVGDGQPTSSPIGGSDIVWGEDAYLFFGDLYSNGLFGYGLGTVEYPMTTTIARVGVTLPYEYLQREDQVMNGDDPGYAQDGNGTQSLLFVLVIEAGNVYKFYDPVNDELFLTTRMASLLENARKEKALTFPGHDGELIR